MSINSDDLQLHIRVIEQLKQDIENGTYKEKEKLPSEFELARKLHVPRAILREAISMLEEENVVVRHHGVGTFVHTKPSFSSGIEQLGSVTEMIKSSGKIPGSQYISTELVNPTENDKKHFAPTKINKIAKIERVRTADGDPVVYCIDRIDKELIPVELVHTQDSLFHFLDQHSDTQIAYAVTYIEPVSYHEEISPVLNCQPDQALLLLKQMHYTKNNRPVLYSANYFRSDVFSFYVLRKR
ncbi:GntR family transcriptional regulator [Aquibacillus kalidii]|uniref:GntR family transcriptional regulator n=1 Tax=Aquibacillus kalidii TaxID=2762597 RepID=UPI00164790ED|nr:GntR family transcriptional regulator [Aquibacillus kalidii]